MNVTLSLDDDLVKKVRKIAVDRDTTLTALIRRYLEEVAAEDSALGRKRRVSGSSSLRLANATGQEKACMPAPDFLHTNILPYAYDPSGHRKQLIARELVRKALAGQMLVSTQVLAEYAAVLLHKMSPPASSKQLTAILNALAPIRVILPDGDMVRRAVEAHAEYGVRFYDGMIVAAAERGGCLKILSEDFNTGQKYFGIAVENPFRDTR
jgi:predicted nucleic acid-binding protein